MRIGDRVAADAIAELRPMRSGEIVSARQGAPTSLGIGPGLVFTVLWDDDGEETEIHEDQLRLEDIDR